MTMKVTDEMLMAYVDGETDAATAEMVAQALSGNAELADRERSFREGRELVRQAFAGRDSQIVPPRLVEAVMRADKQEQDNVIAFPMRRALQFALPLAASLLIGMTIGGFFSGGTIAEDPLGRVAMAEVLGRTKSGEHQAVALAGGEAELRTLATYRIEDGFCRSFDLLMTDLSLSGIGCNRGEGWNILVAATKAQGDFAPASAATASSLDAFLDAVEASAALTPEEEDAAFGRLDDSSE